MGDRYCVTCKLRTPKNKKQRIKGEGIIMEMSQGMTCNVLQYPLETSGAFIMIPEDDWNRQEWRNGFLKAQPEVDASRVDEAFAKEKQS